MTTFQVMPPLSAADYAALKADIAERGVMVPIEVDEAGNVLDGHHREAICDELGIDCPRIVRHGLTEAGKRLHARQLNLARRHLSQEQKRALIAAELRDDAERSNRQIAAGLGVSHHTVEGVRTELEGTGQIAQLDRTTGADGRARTTTPKKPAKPQPEAPQPEVDEERPTRKVKPKRDGFSELMTCWNKATDAERGRFISYVTAPAKRGEMPIDEVVWRLRQALRSGRIEAYDLGFVKGILKRSKTGNWWPTPAEDARMRRVADELSAEPLLDPEDTGNG